jgi:hypothetical protein
MASDIITRNELDIYNKFLDLTKFVDVDYNGVTAPTDPNIPPTSVIITLYRSDAIKNQIKAFLSSMKGDYYGNLGKGGILQEFLSSPMTSKTQMDMRSKILSSLKTEFENYGVLVTDVKVNGDTGYKRWKVYISYIDYLYKIPMELNLQVQG